MSKKTNATKAPRTPPKAPAVGAPVQRVVRRLVRLWRDNEGLLETVETVGDLTSVIRGPGYARPGSIACQLEDTGNGFIARFPGHGSCDMDHCISLDYSQARDLALALTPHAKGLGFDA